jgi:hypothetical protein
MKMASVRFLIGAVVACAILSESDAAYLPNQRSRSFGAQLVFGVNRPGGSAP